jgi:ribonuclease HI
MAQKFYVVWAGRQTGIFTDWASTQRAVEKYAGARFKSFPTRAQAEEAFARGMDTSIARKTAGGQKTRGERAARHTAHQFDVSIYCDGACDPNPGHAGSGIVVYRAGKLAELWFGLYNPMGTNNTAELNAFYHALRMAEAEIKAGNTVEVCSDSAYAINCIRAWAARSRIWELFRTVTQSTGALKKNYTSPTSPATSAPKATSSPIAWPCSPCRAKKKNYARIEKQWIFRRC